MPFLKLERDAQRCEGGRRGGIMARIEGIKRVRWSVWIVVIATATCGAMLR